MENAQPDWEILRTFIKGHAFPGTVVKQATTENTATEGTNVSSKHTLKSFQRSFPHHNPVKFHNEAPLLH